MSRLGGYCAAKNRDGKPCGDRIPTLPSGVRIRTYCHIHRAKQMRDSVAARGDINAKEHRQ